MMSVEQWVREILEAVKRDDSLFDAFSTGADPQTFTAADVIVPTNRLAELLREHEASRVEREQQPG